MIPTPTEDFSDIDPGEWVTRVLAGSIRMRLVVTEVLGPMLVCGDWMFDRRTGMEVDPELGWGPETGVSGSFLERD
jgi:hypothetical protein